MSQTILVIDDEHSVRKLISEILQFAGYQILQAQDGRMGIELAREKRPDLILCDVSMPGMDGFATLAEIRRDTSFSATPFIFLTGRIDRQDIRQGMASGADDYITKPFSAHDLIDGVRARLARQSEAIRENEKKLEDLRGNIVHMLPHELRTPLQGIMGFADILADDYAEMDREQVGDLARRVLKASQRLHRVVENFLVYAQIQIYSKDPQKLADMRQQSCQIDQRVIESMIGERLASCGRGEDLALWIKHGIIQQSSDDLRKIVEEIIDNAIKFSDAGSPISVMGRPERENVYLLSIEDRGRGMKAEQIDSIGAYQQFDRKFHEQQGTGLGLTIARELVHLHDGDFQIHSEADLFTRIEMRFTLNP